MRLLFFLLAVILTTCFSLIIAINAHSPSTSTASFISNPTTAFPRVIGHETVIHPPRRIVSQTLATDEILLALCSPERIASLSPLATNSDYSNVVEIAEKLPRAIHNIEQLVTLQPDLVLFAHYNRAELRSLLAQLQIPQLQLNHFNELADIQANIQRIGYAIGEEARANELVLKMKQQLQQIQAHLPNYAPRVMSYSIDGFTSGKDTSFDAMLRAIGAINISAEQGIRGIVSISEEQLLTWQPEFIVMGASLSQFETILQQLRSRPAFNALNSKIILIEQRYLLTVSHHIIVTIAQLAQQIYQLPTIQALPK